MNPTLTLLPSPVSVCENASRNNGSFHGDDDYQLELLVSQMMAFGNPHFDLTQNLVTLGKHGVAAKIA